MATAEEKQAKQDARDLARSSIVQGQQRLAAEVPRAGSAFRSRRLRSAGDLSRYAIGGFFGDALPPIASPGASKPPAPKPAAPKPKAAAKRATPRPKKAERQTYRVGPVQFKRFQY